MRDKKSADLSGRKKGESSTNLFVTACRVNLLGKLSTTISTWPRVVKPKKLCATLVQDRRGERARSQPQKKGEGRRTNTQGRGSDRMSFHFDRTSGGLAGALPVKLRGPQAGKKERRKTKHEGLKEKERKEKENLRRVR